MIQQKSVFSQIKGCQYFAVLQEKTDFDCVIENLVSSPSHIYWKMKGVLHSILWFRMLDAGMKQHLVNFITTVYISCFITHCGDTQPWNLLKQYESLSTAYGSF